MTRLGPGGSAVRERDPREARRDASRERLALLAQLRAVDHWRRLLAARLDLAVAAVAAPDEPGVPGLGELLGLSAPGTAQSEAALLLRLRAAQRELDAHAVTLRATARTATADVVTRLDVVPAAPAPSGPGGGTGAQVLPLRPRRSRRLPDDVA